MTSKLLFKEKMRICTFPGMINVAKSLDDAEVSSNDQTLTSDMEGGRDIGLLL